MAFIEIYMCIYETYDYNSYTYMIYIGLYIILTTQIVLIIETRSTEALSPSALCIVILTNIFGSAWVVKRNFGL